ncbi:Heavy metal-associated domain [Macleaya cordata]|uniref:Heavy metal-associated domain n=1 Tax=Macleaya cordata TaxID=56857 RepID=A0A200PSU5_MACCD|nr:Heavy metal-associated domain [Macleaya cordata]
MVKHDKEHGGEGSGSGVVTVVYKVNLHCLQCAREIQKPLLRTQAGVQIVDIDIESSEIKVKGRVDPNKIHEQITRISKKKVEMVIQQPKSDESSTSKKKDAPIPSTTTLKVHLHCSKCEYDLKRKLLKLKGVYSVKTDTKAQTLAIEGTIDSNKLVEYIHKKVHKHAEIMTLKQDAKKEEKKGKVKEVLDVKLVESTKITEEIKEEKKLEMKVIKESSTSSVPYIMHYVNYAPQWFSDENPNACSVM